MRVIEAVHIITLPNHTTVNKEFLTPTRDSHRLSNHLKSPSRAHLRTFTWPSNIVGIVSLHHKAIALEDLTSHP